MKIKKGFILLLLIFTISLILSSCKKEPNADDLAWFFTYIKKSNYKMVKKYIKKYDNIINSSLNIMGMEGNALMVAIGLDDMKMVNLLINEGIDLEYAESNGARVIHAAVQAGKLEYVKLLLEAGADPNTKDNIGMNIYHYALYHPSIEMLNLLYKYNKNIDEPDNKGRTPLAAIMADDRPGLDNITMWFLKKGADFKKVIKLAPDMVPGYIDEKRNEVVKYLISHSPAYRNYVDHEGNTISHFSVGLENDEILDYLLENKYYSNKKNGKGETPLAMAKEIGRNDMAKKIEKYLAQTDK